MILFLYGPDTFRSRQKLKELKEKFIQDIDKSALNITVLNGEKLDAQNFSQSVSSPPFLAKKRLVIIEDLIAKNKGQKIQKEILEILSERKLDDTILIFWEGELVKSKKNKTRAKTSERRSNLLLERLKKEKYVQEFELLDTAEVKKWTVTEIKNRGGKINPAALALLTDLVGNDLWQLNSEINKLLAYSPKREIDETAVKELVQTKLDEDIFKLTDAVGQKNKRLALRLIADQFASGLSATELLSKIIWQFKNLLLVKDFADCHGPGYPPQRIAAQFGLHPFVVKKALTQIKNYSLTELKKIYRQLMAAEYKIKTSQADPQVLFDLLIARN